MTRITSQLTVILISTLGIGCGHDQNPPPSGVNDTTVATEVHSFPPEYRTLAAHLSYGLKPNPADFRDDKGLTDIIAEGHAAILDLRALQSKDPDINYIATQATAAFTDAVARMERINALPKPPSTSSVMVNSFIHGFFQNPYAAYELGVDANNKQQAIADELAGATAAIEKADAAHLLLVRVAERYATPTHGDPSRIIVNYDGAWNAWGPHDWCALYNAGGDIADCTVVVELKGANGQTRKNVHYVAKWPSQSWLYARYEPGTELNGRQFGRTTVPDVASLQVRVLAPDYMTDVKYTYAGAEKSKDVSRRVAEVKPHIVPLVRNSAWGASSGKVLVLENRWKYPVFQVGVRVTSSAGYSVGEFVKPQLDAGGRMDVGSWQVSRNLMSGDRVTVWLGEAELLTTVVK